MQATLETRVPSLGWEDSLEEKWQPIPVFLPGESPGQRSLEGYSPKDRKELDVTERLNTQAYTINNNVVIISDEQQRDTALLYTCILSLSNSPPIQVPHNIEQSPL